MKHNILVVSILAVLSSCQSTKTGAPKAIGTKGVISQGDVMANRGPIKLPMNFNTETSKTDELNMLVEFKSLALSKSQTDPNRKAKDIDIKQNQLQVARSYLEKSIAYLRRFDVYMKSSTGEVFDLSSELADIGDVKYQNPVERDVFDLYLQASLLLGGERRELYDGSDELTYSVSVIFVIADQNRSSFGRPIETTGVAKRKLIKDVITGNYLGGYSAEQEGQAIKEAIMDAMKKALPAFGNEFPITASVKGAGTFSIEKMTIDRGSDHGLTNDNQVVVWFKDGGVVAIPVGYARTEAGQRESTITIYKWDKGPAAEFVQEQLKTNPTWLNSNPIYATSMGLSYPQEWERD
ncbi:MAG: hypothetical protein VX038_01290 [Verrucomicrobiota bacterium]|nr:hypothetical protein [Verrucomicrobiota bacterium]